MEEEKKLPKNIRQMAEKEERVRVYLEDYAYTFIRKLACTRRVRTGVLLGSHMMAENKSCWFVKGAVEFADEIDTKSEETIPSETPQEKEAQTKETTNHQKSITQQIWDTTQSVIQEYFPECSICGWFICGTEENFPDGEELKKTHRQIFSGENGLMYWKKGDEESFWMDDEETILHLKGYFVYYEKNPEMQNYMLSRKEEASENVDDEAAFSFRKIMKEKQDIKHPKHFQDSKLRKRQHKKSVRDNTQDCDQDAIQDHIYNGIWVKVCAAVLVGILVGGGVLLSKEIQKKEDSVQALAVGASVERQSGELIESSFEQESQTEHPTQMQPETLKETQQQEQETNEENSDNQAAKSESQEDKKEAAVMQDGGIFSGDMVFYKDGLGASVYRITDKSSDTNEKTQAQTSDEEQSQTENSDGQLADTKNINSQNADSQNSTLAASENTQEVLTIEVPTVEAAVNRPASYTVQPGDTLIEISRKFYGSSQMVMQIKEANGLDDINKIYIGQELTLP